MFKSNSTTTYFLCCIYFFAATVSACEKDTDKLVSASYPIADGTFIQDHLVAKWDDVRWQKEFTVLKEAGMHYLVFAPTLQTDDQEISETIYPTDLPNVKQKYKSDLVENCLRNAKIAGFKVFIGLNFNDKWWNAGNSPEWLYDEMKLGNRVADELVSKYKSRYDDTMYGWYWVWEVDNLNYTTIERQEMLIKALNLNIDHLNEVTPKMPFMLCPFMNHEAGSSNDNRLMWQFVFSRTHFRAGDIFAPQDCVGAGGLKLEMVDEWFSDMNEAVKSKPGLLFWSDAETFDQRFWTAAPLDRFVEQMRIVKPYVSNIITFAYSHYYTPYQITKGFHETYLRYVKTGILPNVVIAYPVTNLTASSDSKGIIDLKWNEPSNKVGLAGYYIYKDNVLIENLQYNSQDNQITGFQCEDPGDDLTHKYKVRSYTCSGEISVLSSVNWK